MDFDELEINQFGWFCWFGAKGGFGIRSGGPPKDLESRNQLKGIPGFQTTRAPIHL